ncbi:GNAT family N-acetyltransferase/peptidase C39 family protein [Nitratireductor luteus]|uniref:GNAT family N-acetyltransferase/peptidase C39 family protein n=1 Tax=Nitratireductor luteus TaxID=2976980 RepID=UPI0022402F4D|nr:GNAT family N-acetyltransferase/peptidase C39 family protein [Nitratireductor luteus]
MSADIRPARASDIDALLAIENTVFDTDRISRRSFRQHVESDTVTLLVGEENASLAGYCLVLYRKGSGVARLYSIAVSPQSAGSGVGRMLLKAAEDAAYAHERLVLRLEVREDNSRAIGLYERTGYRRIGREEDYYEDGAAALRYEKLLRGEVSPHAGVPYYEQTADFTCGPACLMMAKARFDPAFKPSPILEVRLWRQATTVFMMSGPGGCEPFGLAVAAVDIGLAAQIMVSHKGPLFLDSVRDEEKRRVMRLAQLDFRNRARALAIPVSDRAFTLDDIRDALQRGALVAVLISGYLMFGKKVPHWVLAIGDDGGHIFVHDPWVEDERGETAADAANIPIPHASFMRMAQFGRRGLRAAVVLGDMKTR